MYDDLAIDLAMRRHGAVARWELRRRGATPADLRLLASSRQWTEVTDQVLVRRGAPATEGQRLAVAVLDEGAVAVSSHLTGAGWWGVSGCPVRPVHVTTTVATTRRTAADVRHRVRELPPAWCTELDGVPVARPELVALQLFAICREERAEVLVDRLWSSRLLSGPSVGRFLDALGRRGRNGTAGLRRYLAARGQGYVPPASGLESRFDQLMGEAGIPMCRQVDSGDDVTWTGRVDFRHRWLPLVVELQSERYHSALVDRRRDAQRLAALRAAGFRVEEVWDAEVWTRPAEAVARIRRAVLELSRSAR